jgi:predicted DNA-binding transcriptional regulator YafY
MSTSSWTFLSNHTHVLVCIARDPEVTMRQVAELAGITERAVQRIVRDLEDGGYLVRHKQGRSNVYALRPGRPLRHPLERDTELQSLLEVLHATTAISGPAARRSADPRGRPSNGGTHN